MATIAGKTSFRVGDRVTIDFGPHKFTGVIVEDRGALGVQGRHLFRIQVPQDPDEPMNMELSEDEIEVIPPGSEPVPSIAKDKAIEYLTVGGLLSILRENISGGRNQPRVWLCLDNLGNITHTFYPERGVIGGQIPPPAALWEGKIFAPKSDEVKSFLESFGLNRKEAERVVRAVGTAK